MTLKEQIKNEFLEATEVLKLFQNDDNFNKIENAVHIMVEALKKGNKIISCGNGGSMCDAMHFAEELSGRFRNNRRGLAAVSISDPSYITCVGNDYGFESVFSRYIEAIGRNGDVLLGISTSGNSQNIILAAQKAKLLGISTIFLTGKDGGKLSELADIEIRAPHSQYADRAQEIHIKIIHNLIFGIEKILGF
jgi:D-sedoheptulose 7-phosphate isomerase